MAVDKEYLVFAGQFYRFKQGRRPLITGMVTAINISTEGQCVITVDTETRTRNIHVRAGIIAEPVQPPANVPWAHLYRVLMLRTEEPFPWECSK